MRIDAHQHFWIYEPERDTWITEDMKKIRRNFLPTDLTPILKEHSFDGCIAVQAASSEAETEFLVNLSRHNHFIKGIVGWVDLCSPNIEERLDYFSAFDQIKGFRHIVQSEPDDNFLLREDFGRGIRALAKYNFRYDLLLYPKQLRAALEFASRFPDQPIVIDHLAKPSVRSKEINEWSLLMEELSKSPNVHCKLSGLVTEAGWRSWSYEDLIPYVEVVCDCFGANRMMYGSDWPVCLVAADYRQQLYVWEKYFRTFLQRDQDAIFGENAVRFYNLKS